MSLVTAQPPHPTPLPHPFADDVECSVQLVLTLPFVKT